MEGFYGKKKYYNLSSISEKYCRPLGKFTQARKFEQREVRKANTDRDLAGSLRVGGGHGVLESMVLSMAPGW